MVRRTQCNNVISPPTNVRNSCCRMSIRRVNRLNAIISLITRTPICQPFQGLSAASRYCTSCSKQQSCGEKRQRPPGGGRFLTDPNRVFEYNNWDNVEWDEDQEREARLKVDSNSQLKLPAEQQLEYEQNADRYWNDFYGQHQNRFFKDRHWLFTEFPELAPYPIVALATAETGELTTRSTTDATVELPDYTMAPPDADASSKVAMACEPTIGSTETERVALFPGQQATTRFFEVGCGVGNTVIPVLQTNNDPSLFVYGCDLSSTAVRLLREHPDYEPARCHAFVCDVADPGSTVPFPDESLDVIICIFVLSAIHPDKLPALSVRLARLLKPGGLIVFRDYGRYDLTQLRFKMGRCLGDNLYARGDGTKVYFFTQEELRALFVDGAGLIEQQNLIDRRLQVNRSRQIKMYRVWIQCKFRKPAVAAAATSL